MKYTSELVRSRDVPLRIFAGFQKRGPVLRGDEQRLGKAPSLLPKWLCSAMSVFFLHLEGTPITTQKTSSPANGGTGHRPFRSFQDQAPLDPPCWVPQDPRSTQPGAEPPPLRRNRGLTALQRPGSHSGTTPVISGSVSTLASWSHEYPAKSRPPPPPPFSQPSRRICGVVSASPHKNALAFSPP